MALQIELEADIADAVFMMKRHCAGKQASYWLREYKRLMRKAGVME